MAETQAPSWAQVVAPDVLGLHTLLANLYLVGTPGAGNPWTLVDAGLFNCGPAIQPAAAELYGSDNPPRSIVVTHAHFDHVGAIPYLLRTWDVPVYAPEKELPYLTGRAVYPPPDPDVDKGLTAQLSPLYPCWSPNIEGQVEALPEDGSVPGLPGWRWIATPGHTPGHVSFFRDEDRVLLAGDAFVTTKQESAYSAITQKPVTVHRPPAYFTANWQEAQQSVEILAALHPSAVGTGHGKPVHGEKLERELQDLARNFFQRSVPRHAYYAQHPVETSIDGDVLTPLPPHPLPKFLAKVGVITAGVALAVSMGKKRLR